MTALSGLSGLSGLLPWPTVATWFLDTFTDANNTTMANHTPDTRDPRVAAWSQNVANAIWIQSNTATPNRYTDADLAVCAIGGTADFTIQCTTTPFSSSTTVVGHAGVIFRYVSTTNFWYTFADSGNGRIMVYKVVAGTHTEMLRYAYSLASGTPVTLRVDCKGPNITLWIDGVERVTIVDWQHSTATGFGMRVGKSGAPAGKPVWEDFSVTAYAGTYLRWPVFTKYASNPVVALGTGGAWDDKDVNNPNVVYDSANSRWALNYSGYDGDGSNVQDAGMAYATNLSGPWTKSASNPVMTSEAEDGIYTFKGGLVKKGSTWYHFYGSDNGTTIRLATATDLDGAWTRQGVVLEGTAAEWDANGVFDACVRLREDGTTFELWYGGSTDGTQATRQIGYATSSDGVTFTKSGDNPLFGYPAWTSTEGLGAPSVYVPPGKEGSEYLVTFDAGRATTTTRRQLHQAISLDGGGSWRFRTLVLDSSAAGWDNSQVFDSFILVDSGTMYLYYAGANTSGLALNLNIQVGVATCAWPHNTLQG